MKSICVFCGSSLGINSIYKEQIIELGNILCKKNIQLIYGGGKVGLMGTLAEYVMKNNGRVTGIIPEKLFHKVKQIDLTELIVVKDMHERKAKMHELSDGFIAFPGGIGTLEEIAEAFTWYQLGYHYKPTALLNINNYYSHLIAFLEHMVKEGFLKKEQLQALIVNDNIEDLIYKMDNHIPVTVDKWLDR